MDVDQGICIMENILKTWSSNAPDSEDVSMDDQGDVEQQLGDLRKCVEEFKPQIEQNKWLQSVIISL